MRNLHCRVTFEGNVFQPVGRDLSSVSFEFLGLHFEGVLKMFLPLSLYLLLSLSLSQGVKVNFVSILGSKSESKGPY